jgi:DNA-binding LytR/AlgR family response regulator
MNFVIIEDEELAAKRLEGMIHAFDPGSKVLARLESVEEAVEWFSNNPEPDLIFLDIHLEDGLSFSIFERVTVKAPIIFTTAFDEYAIKAFRLRSIDYLLKPITQSDLNAAILKYRDWNLTGAPVIDVDALYEILSRKNRSYKNRFSFQVGQKIKMIPVEEIAYFYSSESITMMVCRDRSEYAVDYSLDQLSAELDPAVFYRISRQFLVSLSAIAHVHVYPKSRLRLELNPAADQEVFVSIDKAVRFREWLNS